MTEVQDRAPGERAAQDRAGHIRRGALPGAAIAVLAMGAIYLLIVVLQ